VPAQGFSGLRNKNFAQITRLRTQTGRRGGGRRLESTSRTFKMENLYQFPSPSGAAPARKARGGYRKKASRAEIQRLVNTAVDLGLTIYGIILDGERVQLLTKPNAEQCRKGLSEVDRFFEADHA
jgi:hypothetical protein